MPSQVKTRQVKSCPAKFKAVDESQGTFTALVSVFGNVDLIGDRVMQGAFTKSLEKWKTSGDPIPVIWNHMWEDPNAHIGKTLSATETDEGLVVEGQVDLEDPFAAKVFRLMKERRVKEMSFAYDVPEGGEQFNKEEKVNDLLELELIEVGPTLKGMNPDTQLFAAKAFEEVKLKAGRVLSSKNESELNSAIEEINSGIKRITGVLAQLQQNDEAKSEEPQQAKSEEPSPAKLEEPAEVKDEEPDLIAELFNLELNVTGAM